MNIKTISKQYLAYYIYRIITKYYNIVELGLSTSDINEFMTYLRIPKEHNRLLNYPLAGKLTNDKKILDMIILKGIDILTKTDKYIKSLPTNITTYDDVQCLGNMNNILKKMLINISKTHKYKKL